MIQAELCPPLVAAVIIGIATAFVHSKTFADAANNASTYVATRTDYEEHSGVWKLKSFLLPMGLMKKKPKISLSSGTTSWKKTRTTSCTPSILER